MGLSEYLIDWLKKKLLVQCGVCNSQGEVDADSVDDIIIDADGIHRLQ